MANHIIIRPHSFVAVEILNKLNQRKFSASNFISLQTRGIGSFPLWLRKQTRSSFGEKKQSVSGFSRKAEC
jgi:hypothetical protein